MTRRRLYVATAALATATVGFVAPAISTAAPSTASVPQMTCGSTGGCTPPPTVCTPVGCWRLGTV